MRELIRFFCNWLVRTLGCISTNGVPLITSNWRRNTNLESYTLRETWSHCDWVGKELSIGARLKSMKYFDWPRHPFMLRTVSNQYTDSLRKHFTSTNNRDRDVPICTYSSALHDVLTVNETLLTCIHYLLPIVFIRHIKEMTSTQHCSMSLFGTNNKNCVELKWLWKSEMQESKNCRARLPSKNLRQANSKESG